MRKIRPATRSSSSAAATRAARQGRQNMINEDRVVVEGVNIVIKHIKRGRARQAGIVEVEAPLARLERDADLTPRASSRRGSAFRQVRTARTSASARSAERRFRGQTVTER